MCTECRDRIELFLEAGGWEERQGKLQRAPQCIRTRMANMVGCLIRLLLGQKTWNFRKKCGWVYSLQMKVKESVVIKTGRLGLGNGAYLFFYIN